ncbi:MAG: CPBP family glutamic-type intramembrane protease [Caldilineaceae bacterium]
MMQKLAPQPNETIAYSNSTFACVKHWLYHGQNPGRIASPLAFFIWVFVFSSPFWLLGALLGKQFLPGIPTSALMVLAPLLAAVLLVYREQHMTGVIDLLKRAMDYRRIKDKLWYAPILLLMPSVMLVEFGILRCMGSPIPAPQFTVTTAPALFLTFFVTASMEQVGWMGYAIDPLQARFDALQAGLLLGLVWAVWHFIPLWQVGRTWDWIAWWSLATVAQRVIIVWLYNNTGKSVFATALYQAMMNLTWQLFPVNGSFYDPRITALIVGVIASIVILLWGGQTLADYRSVPSN